MQRGCFFLKVKEELLADYLANHEVWPEMLDAIREAGVRNYTLFYKGNGLLVGYLEGDDIRGALRRVGETDVNRRWQEFMSQFFEGGSGDLESGGMEWLTEYFHTE
jgi:L-rhamnose mutarotase